MPQAVIPAAAPTPHHDGPPGQRVPAGYVVLGRNPGDQANHDVAGMFPPSENNYVVFSHGTDGTVKVGDREVSPAELAAIITNDENYHGQPITLIACNTGDNANGYANRLAQAMPPGTQVTAPSTTAWTTADGQAFVAPTTFGPDGRPQPGRPTPNDTWKTFTSGNPAVTQHGPDLAHAGTPRTDSPGHRPVSWTRDNNKRQRSDDGDREGKRSRVDTDVEMIDASPPPPTLVDHTSTWQEAHQAVAEDLANDPTDDEHTKAVMVAAMTFKSRNASYVPLDLQSKNPRQVSPWDIRNPDYYFRSQNTHPSLTAASRTQGRGGPKPDQITSPALADELNLRGNPRVVTGTGPQRGGAGLRPSNTDLLHQVITRDGFQKQGNPVKSPGTGLPSTGRTPAQRVDSLMNSDLVDLMMSTPAHPAPPHGSEPLNYIDQRMQRSRDISDRLTTAFTQRPLRNIEVSGNGQNPNLTIYLKGIDNAMFATDATDRATKLDKDRVVEWAQVYLAGLTSSMAAAAGVHLPMQIRQSFGSLDSTLANTAESIRLSPGSEPPEFHAIVEAAVRRLDSELPGLIATMESHVDSGHPLVQNGKWNPISGDKKYAGWAQAVQMTSRPAGPSGNSLVDFANWVTSTDADALGKQSDRPFLGDERAQTLDSMRTAAKNALDAAPSTYPDQTALNNLTTTVSRLATGPLPIGVDLDNAIAFTNNLLSTYRGQMDTGPGRFPETTSFALDQIESAVQSAQQAANTLGGPATPAQRADAHTALRNAAEDLQDAAVLLAAAVDAHAGRNPAAEAQILVRDLLGNNSQANVHFTASGMQAISAALLTAQSRGIDVATDPDAYFETQSHTPNAFKNNDPNAASARISDRAPLRTDLSQNPPNAATNPSDHDVRVVDVTTAADPLNPDLLRQVAAENQVSQRSLVVASLVKYYQLGTDHSAQGIIVDLNPQGGQNPPVPTMAPNVRQLMSMLTDLRSSNMVSFDPAIRDHLGPIQDFLFAPTAGMTASQEVQSMQNLLSGLGVPPAQVQSLTTTDTFDAEAYFNTLQEALSNAASHVAPSFNAAQAVQNARDNVRQEFPDSNLRAVPVHGPAGPAPSLSQVPPATVATPTASTPTVGDPIDVSTGRMIYTETDVRLPGLTVERTHRSDYRWGRSFGPTWASTLDQRIVTEDRTAWFLAADGSVGTYPVPAEGERALPVVGRGGPLLRLAGGGWLLTENGADLLFAPAEDGTDALLSDVSTGALRWSVARDEDGTPAFLVSSSGTEVRLDTVDGLVTGAHVVPAGGDPVALPGFGYDRHRRLTSVVNSSGDETRLDYDDEGRIVRWQDRNDEWFTYAYDAAGRCVATTGSGGYLSYTFEYGDGRTVVTDSLGHRTRYELNDRLQVTAVVDPLGAVVRQEWDAAGRLLSRTDPLGRVTRLAVGDDGRAPALIGPDGTTRVLAAPAAREALDDLGRPRARRRLDGTADELGWTAEGDLAWRTRPDGSERLWHYDGEGNLVEVTDEMGRAVRFEYGPFDLPIARIDELGNRTEFAYDTELRLTAVTNPLGQIWRYAYDPAGRLSEQTDFDGRTQRYTHDGAGQLVVHVDAAGTSTRYRYDVLGRVVERRVDDLVTRLEYGADGHVAAVLSPDATVRFERDERGRVIAETINGRTVRTSYHGESDMVAARTTPSGRVSRWTFDADGHPESLAAGASYLLRFEHDAAGREISRTIGDLVALQQSFDAAGRLTGQRIAGAAERGFAYDAADRITAVTDSLAGDRRIDADDAGRIRAVNGAVAESYDYDEAGNLIGSGGERWEFAGTMLVRSGDATFAYDDKGRLTERRDAAGTWRFAWDAEDRMVEALTPGSERWRYRYDGFGRRIAKQLVGDDGRVRREVSFAWSGDLMLEQTDGTATTSWDYRPDGTAPVTQADGDAVRTVITDTIGTPTHLVEPSGALRWWSRGDLWGRTDPAAATPLRFPGQYFDAETGLHYNRFRYYDPATARFLSPDPLGLSGGANPTAYVSDPLTLADPLGLTSCKPGQSTTSSTTATPTPTPTPEPSSLPNRAEPPAADALYGMPQWVRVETVHPDGSRTYRDELRDTPSPPPLTTPSGMMAAQAHSWYSNVAWAPASSLSNPSSSAAQSYNTIRASMNSLTGGSRPRTGPRSERNLQFNEPMMGNRRYNGTDARPGIGEDIADEPDGGRRTAAQIANYLNGFTDLTAIRSAAGRDFARIVNFSERARGYDQEVNMLPATLTHINALERSSDASRYWNNIGSWFPPARAGYASDAYVPPSERPPAAALISGPRRSQTITSHALASGSSSSHPNATIVNAAPRNTRSRSPERESRSTHRSSHRSRRRSRSRYGFQDSQTGGPIDLSVTPATTQFTGTTPLADQLTALDGNPQAQHQVLNAFREQLASTVRLSDGSTLQVLAANVHGETANTDADLQTLNSVDRGYQQQIYTNRDVTNTNDCVTLVLAADAYKRTGVISQIPAQTQPRTFNDLISHYPGRDATEVRNLSGLMDALGAMPNGTNGIVGIRTGAPGTTGHVINVSKDDQGRVTFEDTQEPGLGTLSETAPESSVFLIQTSDPSPSADSSRDVDMTSDYGGDSDVDMTSDRGSVRDLSLDHDGDVVMDAFTPTTEPFTGITPASVAKTTAETPTVGDPIDVTTGRMILTHTDATLPGLTLERTYRSDYRWGRSFGRAWASTLDQRIIVDGEQVRYLAADGSVLTYPLPAEGDVTAPLTGRALPLRRLVGGGWLLTDQVSGRSLLFAPASDTESLLSDLTDAGVRWSISRDRRGTPTAVRSSTGADIVFDSSAGLVTMMSLPTATNDLMIAAQFGYDRELNLVKVINSAGEAESFDYSAGRMVRWEDRNGEWYTYTYDEAGRTVSTEGKGGYLSYRFDYRPARTTVTDSLGAARVYELNDRLQVVAETDPLGATKRFVWDEAYRLRSTTDELGRTTTSEYGADGQLISVTRPDGSRSTTAYDELGRAVSWTDFDGSIRNRTFESTGLMAVEVDGAGQVVRFEQPADGGTGTATHIGPMAVVRNPAQQVVAVRAGADETRYEYDALGRIFSAQDDKGVTEYGWTLEGDLAWRENSDGSVEEYLYDGEGNLVESLDATGRRTFREYGAFDLVTAEIDEDANRTEYAYDTELRLVAITDPAGRTWEYRYDPNGRVVEETDFDGRTQRYAYDAAGQLVEHTNGAGEVTHYTYDVLGRMVERRSGDTVARFEYDPSGRLVTARNGDSQVQLERNQLGRVVAESLNGTTVSTSYHEATGLVAERTRPTGPRTRWSYDELGRPTVLVAGEHQIRFLYDGGHEVSRTSDAGLALRQEYDDAGRLSAQLIEKVTDRRYAYDETGRLTAVHDAVQGDRVIAAEEPGDVRYTYDALSRPVTRTGPAGESQFTWDDQGRLIGVTTAAGERWLYRYDALSRRIAKQRLGANDAVLEEFAFVWSSDLLVEQLYRTRSGTVSTAWEYHPAQACPVVQVTDGVVHTVVTDPTGAPIDLVNVDGTPAGDAGTIPIGAHGRYLDPETGLQYDGFRFYDPATATLLPEPVRTPAVWR